MTVATPAPIGPAHRRSSRTLTPQRRRVLRLLALVSLPLVAMACALTVWGAREDRGRIAERRQFRAEAAAMSVDAYLSGDLGTLRSLALSPIITQRYHDDGLDYYMGQFLLANPDWENISLFDSRGKSIASTRGPPGSIDISHDPYFRTILATGSPLITTQRDSDEPDHGHRVILAVPVRFDAGARGVLVARIPAARLAQVILPFTGSPGATIALVDAAGDELVRVDEHGREHHLSHDLSSGPPVVAASSKIVERAGGDEHLVSSVPVTGLHLAVVLRDPTAVVFHPAWMRLATEISLVAVALALMVCGGWYFGGKLALYTERAERARERAERAQQELEEALKTRDWVLASATHDLRSPLSSIHLTAQHLQGQISGPNGPKVEHIGRGLARIEGSSSHMASLIDSLLDVARLQVGKPLVLERRSFDMVALVREVVAEHQRMTERHHLCLLADEDRVVGDWDRSRLRRVIGNLVDNAVKYSPAGGDVTIRITLDKTTNEVTLEIQDYGIGIDKSDLIHVFSHFWRAKNVASIPGSGMGLPGAKQIIEEHHGTIAIASEAGKGSRFTIRLPLTTPPQAPRHHPAAAG